MSFRITNWNKISITKGDQASFNLDIVDEDDKERKPANTDTLLLEVFSDDLKFTKTASIVNNQWLFTIDKADTENIEKGLYTYIIYLINSAGSKYTIIDRSIFEVLGGEYET